MKKYIILIFVMLAAARGVDAKIWRVNNNAGVWRNEVSIQDV